MEKIEPINLSPSFLSSILKYGYDYAVGEKLGLIQKDTESMSDGRLMHALIAERFGHEPAKVVVSPFKDFRTNAAKAWRDSQPDDVTIMKDSELNKFNDIADRVINHPEIKKLLKGNIEVEKKCENKVSEFNVKGILDLIATDGEYKIVIDWKYCSSKVFDDFAKKALYSNYDLQATVYDFLEKPTQIYFAAIENEAPHRIRLWHCDLSVYEQGAAKFDKALKIIKENDWRQPTFDIVGVDEIKAWGY